jgi:hypothetical protein
MNRRALKFKEQIDMVNTRNSQNTPNTKSNDGAAAGGYALTQGKETDEDDIKRKQSRHPEETGGS